MGQCKVMFLGPPGAGKGTQAKLVCSHYGWAHISTGDILRAHLKQKTQLGLQAQEFIDRGDLVPDSIMIDLVRSRLQDQDCKAGFLLDGFPRTVAQAQALSEFISLDAVMDLNISLEKITQRLTGRRMCHSCGMLYHVLQLPKDKTVCPACQGDLYQREDDEIQTVQHRLKVYQEQTFPLVQFYQEQGILFKVNADRPVEAITEDICQILERCR